MKHIFFYILLLASFTNAYSLDKVIIDRSLTSQLISNHISYLEDETNTLTFNDVVNSKKFVVSEREVVNFQVSGSTYWLKFTIANKDNNRSNFVKVGQPLLNIIDFYSPNEYGQYQVVNGGIRFAFNQRKYPQSPDFIFDLDLQPGTEKTYFLKIKGEGQLRLPLLVVTQQTLNANLSNLTLWIGMYCGIILVMVFYNIFIFLSIRDKSYLYYVLHTLFVGLTQLSLLGLTYKYFWPGSPWFANYSNFLFTCLVSIIGVQFLIEFMHLKKNARLLFRILRVFQLVYVIYLFTSLAGYYHTTYGAILPTQSLIAVFILIISIYLYKKGFAEAKYYLIGWSSLMFGILVYVAMDYGWLPFNNFTAYSLLFGSAAEVTLLSFALADKINIYKIETAKMQQDALHALVEKERMVREQNVMLENKVQERTHELRVVNNDLNKVLKELKDAEGYLVESEKMAALGQLTAGIAHEINNPINFVSSNVTPLKRDVEMLTELISHFENVGLSEMTLAEKQKTIEDYKEHYDFDYLKIEIGQLINGIQEGASRTAEIVKGLRIFSRVDEDDLKEADINEGLDSTIILINNLLNKVELIKAYEEIPMIECYPGKLNQVFLNLISNAIHAIQKRHGDKPGGFLKIGTTRSDTSILVSVTDNGTGMDELTKKKIFEPFFTTKDVGEGTGLGMSIAYNIIKKHNGHLNITSTPGLGSEFILDLPIIHT